MPFNDDNTLEDIEGCYLVLTWKNAKSERDFDKSISEFIERIENKLARTRNKIRHNWFSIALDYAKQAKQHYRDGQVEIGRELLRKAWEHLESGNKASRRKTTFIAESDGNIRPI